MSTKTRAAIEVREMKASDVPNIMKQCEEAEGIRVLPWETVELFKRAIRRNPGYSQVSIDPRTGNVVGFVFAGHDGLRGSFHHLWVAPAYQRRGLGRKMVQRVLACFRADVPAVRRIRLIVLASSAGALIFWERIGFIRSSGATQGDKVVAFYYDL